MILIMIVSIFHLIPSIDLCYFVCSCHCSAFFPTISRCFSCSPSSSDGKKTSGSLSKVMGPQTYIFAFLFQHGGFLSFCQRHGFLAGRVWVFLTFRVFLFVTSWVLEQRFSTPTVEMIPNWRLISCFWSTSKKGCEMLPAALPIWIGGAAGIEVWSRSSLLAVSGWRELETESPWICVALRILDPPMEGWKNLYYAGLGSSTK